MTATPNHALQRTAPCVTAPASAAAFPPTVQVPRRTPRSLSLGSLGVTPPVVTNRASFRVRREFTTYPETHGLASVRRTITSGRSFSPMPSVPGSVSTDGRFWSSLSFMRSEDTRLLPVVVREVTPNNATPNQALQRTATAVTARASAAAFPPAMHGPRQPPPSLSLGSLGGIPHHTHHATKRNRNSNSAQPVFE